MNRRRVVFWSGWVLVAAGVILVVKHLQADTGKADTVQPRSPGNMSFARLRKAKLSNGFVWWVPDGWERGGTEYGFIFRNQDEEDFMANVHLYWRPERRALRKWIDNQRKKRMGGGSKILLDEPASTAGMSGQLLIYETITQQEGGTELRTVTKDWLFGRGGMVGILRGVATGAQFVNKYQSLWDEIHRRLRYEPPTNPIEPGK